MKVDISFKLMAIFHSIYDVLYHNNGLITEYKLSHQAYEMDWMIRLIGLCQVKVILMRGVTSVWELGVTIGCRYLEKIIEFQKKQVDLTQQLKDIWTSKVICRLQVY